VLHKTAAASTYHRPKARFSREIGWFKTNGLMM